MGALILCYHHVTTWPAGHPRRVYSVTPGEFRQQMANLARRGYRGFSLADLAAPSAQSDPKSFGITFDDGYLDNYEHAWPVLRDYGFGATVFLVGAWLRNSTQYGSAPAPLLTRSHILHMARYGIEFGGHSQTHRRLTELAASELEEEIAGCKAGLEAALDLPIMAFSYPYGLSSANVRRSVQYAGYGMAVAVGNGDGSRFNLRRLQVQGDRSAMAFTWQTLRWRPGARKAGFGKAGRHG